MNASTKLLFALGTTAAAVALIYRYQSKKQLEEYRRRRLRNKNAGVAKAV